jgi:hypothetical protein
MPWMRLGMTTLRTKFLDSGSTCSFSFRGTTRELSSKAINQNARENEELKLEFLECAYTHASLAGTTSQHWVGWKVARTDLKVHKQGKLDISKESSGFALLNKMMSAGKAGMKKEGG